MVVPSIDYKFTPNVHSLMWWLARMQSKSQTGRQEVINAQTITSRKNTGQEWGWVQSKIWYWHCFDLPSQILRNSVRNFKCSSLHFTSFEGSFPSCYLQTRANCQEESLQLNWIWSGVAPLLCGVYVEPTSGSHQRELSKLFDILRIFSSALFSSSNNCENVRLAPLLVGTAKRLNETKKETASAKVKWQVHLLVTTSVFSKCDYELLPHPHSRWTDNQLTITLWSFLA